MNLKPLFYMILGAFLVLFSCDDTDSSVSTKFPDEQNMASDEWDDDTNWALEKRRHRYEKVTVMTWNVYVGTDVDKVLAAQNPEEIPVLVAEAFALLQQTNFAERADFMAKEIARKKPHLIGLQEISKILLQSPGDAHLGNPVQATDVYQDFLEIFMAALHHHRQHYSVAGIIQNTDVEVPMLVSVDPLAFDDVRLIDYDVVLVHNGVEYSNVVTANYNARLPISTFGIDILRGYVAVDATICGNDYRFVSTHLESDYDPIQLAQASELIGYLQTETKPVILVGDFNSNAALDEVTYQFITGNDFVETWPLNHGWNHQNPDGLTAPHDPDLRNTDIHLAERIDLVFFRPEMQSNGELLIKSRVIGDEYRERTRSKMWPSDHAGVAVKLAIPYKRN